MTWYSMVPARTRVLDGLVQTATGRVSGEAGRGGVPDGPHTTEHCRPCGAALLGQAVMQVDGCQLAEAGGMLLGGLPGKKTWQWARNCKAS